MTCSSKRSQLPNTWTTCGLRRYRCDTIAWARSMDVKTRRRNRANLDVECSYIEGLRTLHSPSTFFHDFQQFTSPPSQLLPIFSTAPETLFNPRSQHTHTETPFFQTKPSYCALRYPQEHALIMAMPRRGEDPFATPGRHLQSSRAPTLVNGPPPRGSIPQWGRGPEGQAPPVDHSYAGSVGSERSNQALRGGPTRGHPNPLDMPLPHRDAGRGSRLSHAPSEAGTVGPRLGPPLRDARSAGPPPSQSRSTYPSSPPPGSSRPAATGTPKAKAPARKHHTNGKIFCIHFYTYGEENHYTHDVDGINFQVISHIKATRFASPSIKVQKNHTGLDAEVATAIFGIEANRKLYRRILTDTTKDLDKIASLGGCVSILMYSTAGMHRSVAVAERLAKDLKRTKGWEVQCKHLDMEQGAADERRLERDKRLGKGKEDSYMVYDYPLGVDWGNRYLESGGGHGSDSRYELEWDYP